MLATKKSFKKAKRDNTPRIITKDHGDYKGPSIELIGEGPYFLMMLDELLYHDVNVVSYVVYDMPNGSEIIRDINVHNFTTPWGLSRIMGAEDVDYSLIFWLKSYYNSRKYWLVWM